MKKTIYDIAKDLDVAPSTVSKALNNRSGISEKLKTKIQNYANEVRYYANASASKLKMKKSFSIGIIYSEDLNIGLEHNFFSSILQSFKTYVEAHGYEITFVINNLANRKISYLDFCMQKNIDGVFIVTSTAHDPLLKELVESDIACVSTDVYYDNLFTVISDNIDGAKQAVDYFYQMGHEKIGIITEAYDTVASQERLRGFKEKMQALHLEVIDDYIIPARKYAYEDGYDAGQKFLKLNTKPTAVFVVSDVIAMGFIKALKDGGLKVPDDISVIGFDDIPFAKHYEPRLTTINQNTKTIGERAAIKLLHLMECNQEKTTGIEKVPVTLVKRDSVKNLKQ